MDDIHLDNSDNSNDSYAHDSTKLQDMEDDKEFLLELVHAMKNYPSLWDIHNLDFNNYKMREQHWREIETKLQDFKRDLKTIKLRWRLAKFSYMCIRLEDHITTEDNTYSKCLKNLPVDEMSYLCF
ncbi:uncharacterized protein LOC119685507 [Teleopsis dalmanni]|nr:uncharacterized protein LOC119685507 [Teleopsis dalmanni]